MPLLPSGGQSRHSGSPLIPLFLRKYPEKKLIKIIKNGLPATQMPPFPDLTEKQIKSIIAYIKTPAKIQWSSDRINSSITIVKGKGKELLSKRYKKRCRSC
ncbi:MAG: cytochrome c [Persephonella sp.]|nr:cytochrome c [Persephonella sp.]